MNVRRWLSALLSCFFFSTALVQAVELPLTVLPKQQSCLVYQETIAHVEAYKEDKIFPPYPSAITEIDYDNNFICSINDHRTTLFQKKSRDGIPLQARHGSCAHHLIFYLPLHYLKKIENLVEKKIFAIQVKKEQKEPFGPALTPFVITHTVDPKTQMVRFSIPMNSSFQPGQFVYIKIFLGEQERLLLPKETISMHKGKAYVKRIEEYGQHVIVPVTLGEEIDTFRVVLSGIKSQERFMTKFSDEIDQKSF